MVVHVHSVCDAGACVIIAVRHKIEFVEEKPPESQVSVRVLLLLSSIDYG